MTGDNGDNIKVMFGICSTIFHDVPKQSNPINFVSFPVKEGKCSRTSSRAPKLADVENV